MKRILLFILLLASCAKVPTLNLEKHRYQQRANNIIWFQIPGLDLEHLAMLRFNAPQSFELGPFENIQCVGHAWNYNIYKIRPSVMASISSQISGSLNTKNNCQEYKKRPLWDYLKEIDYNTAILEIGANQETSLYHSWQCGEEFDTFYKDISIWSMKKAPAERNSFFHYQDGKKLLEEGIYFDQSCQQQEVCFSSAYQNALSMYKRLRENSSRSLFIYRNFSYFQALTKKDFSLARETLTEIEKTWAFFRKMAEEENILLVLTSTSSLKMSFPNRAKDWYKLENKGKGVAFYEESLISPVLAFGPGSENFCGIYDQADIFKRFLWPSRKKLQINDIFSNLKGYFNN